MTPRSPLAAAQLTLVLLGPSQGSDTALKVVAVPTPAARHPGLPATTLLFDEETGKVSAMVNASELTGLRTAAASAAATRLLANPKSQRLVVFGTGAQAYYHARLILDLFPSVTELVFVARSASARATALLLRVQDEYVDLQAALVTPDQTAEAIRTADIICTCVPSTEPLFAIEDLKDGVHINAIGSYQPHMRADAKGAYHRRRQDVPVRQLDQRHAHDPVQDPPAAAPAAFPPGRHPPRPHRAALPHLRARKLAQPGRHRQAEL